MESMPLSMMKHLEDDVPPVFMILDTFDKDIKVKLLYCNCVSFQNFLFLHDLIFNFVFMFHIPDYYFYYLIFTVVCKYNSCC